MLQETIQYGVTCNLLSKIFLAAGSLIMITLSKFSHVSSQLTFCFSESIHIIPFSWLFDQKLCLLNLSFKPFFISDGTIQKTTIFPLQGFKVQMSQPYYINDTRGPGSKTHMEMSFHVSLKISYPLLKCSRRRSKYNFTIFLIFSLYSSIMLFGDTKFEDISLLWKMQTDLFLLCLLLIVGKHVLRKCKLGNGLNFYACKNGNTGLVDDL